MTLLQFVIQSGVLSRRNAFGAIREGYITVNHFPITNPSQELLEKDSVVYNRKVLELKPFSYVLINKPKGCITSKKDPSKRPVVFDYLPADLIEELDPVGRLDCNTTGALLLTNDGKSALLLSHPRYKVQKTYHVTLSRGLSEEQVMALKKGIMIEHKLFIRPDDVVWHPKQPDLVKISLHSGQNRVIRRMVEQLGCFVKKLHRVSFAGLKIDKLKEGEYMFIEPKKIMALLKDVSDPRPHLGKKPVK
jgi:23S rRNA pseudouridine2605 synthase